jgi:H+-translocating NAD(P) transhydrogenase subunit alpha
MIRRNMRQTLAWSGLLLAVCAVFAPAGWAQEPPQETGLAPVVAEPPAPTSVSTHMPVLSRSVVLVGSLTVFALAVFVGFEVIAKVPPTLHTPLMSGSNAISGITVVGAIIAAGHTGGGVGAVLGLVAVTLAMINVVGGFAVTRRMLKMFRR